RRRDGQGPRPDLVQGRGVPRHQALVARRRQRPPAPALVRDRGAERDAVDDEWTGCGEGSGLDQGTGHGSQGTGGVLARATTCPPSPVPRPLSPVPCPPSPVPR